MCDTDVADLVVISLCGIYVVDLVVTSLYVVQMLLTWWLRLSVWISLLLICWSRLCVWT